MNQDAACHIPVTAVENGSSSHIINQTAESREESKTLHNNSENFVAVC